MTSVSEEIYNSAILIVDDSPTNVLLLKKILEKGGYHHVDTTTDSRKVEGLVAAKEYDLLLLDIRMPFMDGYQVMEKLGTSNDGALPVLILTAELSSEVIEKVIESGAKDILSKPCDRNEALNRIYNTLETRLLNKKLGGKG